MDNAALITPVESDDALTWANDMGDEHDGGQAGEQTGGGDKPEENHLVALIDTGVPQGDPNVEAARSVLPAEPGDGADADDGAAEAGAQAGSPWDDSGHGTLMLETMKAENPGVRVLSVKALDSRGRGTAASVMAAIQLAREAGAEVVNLSLSGPANEENMAIAAPIREAAADSVAVIAAAGNDGADARAYTPANVEEALVVGAADQAKLDAGLEGEDTRLAASNFGPTVDGYAVAGSTSAAAARVAGAASRGDASALSGKGWFSWSGPGLDGDAVALDTDPTDEPPGQPFSAWFDVNDQGVIGTGLGTHQLPDVQMGSHSGQQFSVNGLPAGGLIVSGFFRGGDSVEWTITYSWTNGAGDTGGGTVARFFGAPYGNGAAGPWTVDMGTGHTAGGTITFYGYHWNFWTTIGGSVTIERAPLTKIDAPDLSGQSLDFTGEEQKVAVPEGANYELVSGTAGTDAGDYTAKAVPLDGYCWQDGTTDAKDVQWVINPYFPSPGARRVPDLGRRPRLRLRGAKPCGKGAPPARPCRPARPGNRPPAWGCAASPPGGPGGKPGGKPRPGGRGAARGRRSRPRSARGRSPQAAARPGRPRRPAPGPGRPRGRGVRGPRRLAGGPPPVPASRASPRGPGPPKAGFGPPPWYSSGRRHPPGCGHPASRCRGRSGGPAGRAGAWAGRPKGASARRRGARPAGTLGQFGS